MFLSHPEPDSIETRRPNVMCLELSTVEWTTSCSDFLSALKWRKNTVCGSWDNHAVFYDAVLFYQMLMISNISIWPKVYLGVMAMKWYSTFPRLPELESRLPIQFSDILWIPLYGRLITLFKEYNKSIAQLAAAAEYTNCFSAEG